MRQSTLRNTLVASAAAALAALLPATAQAQSGKWVATVSQINSIGGSADITIESRDDKRSRVKVTLRNVRSNELRVAWDIAAGQCRDQGAPIAPQATFTQIQTMSDGSGTVTANVPKLEPGKQYYIRVFDPQVSPTDNNVWGCANIAEKP
jgi:hypothetical protein